MAGGTLALVDPPRAGLAPEAVRALLAAPPARLVYVSCAPDTLARDLAEFAAARAESIAIRDKSRERKVRASVLDAPKMLPLAGTVPCGAPVLAVENIEEMIPSPPKVNADFALTCKGESMINARIFPGDIVYIKRQPIVDNGEIAAVLIGEEATLKRVYIYKNRLTLMPENPLFDPINLVGEEMNQATILGKAVAVVSFLNIKNL